jgi:predicted nucleic acid-binding protein
MLKNAFVDSCVFIAYATEFEIFHPACISFFEENRCEKYTSESVAGELKRKLKRRDELYKDYSKFLADGGKGEYTVPSNIYVNKNDNRHLKELVRHLSNTPADAQLTFLRLFGKRLRIRIDKSMGFIKEVIPRNNDAYFKDIIRAIIKNDYDSWILNDAIQWALSNSEVVFVTLDGEIYYNRGDLLRVVKDHKFLTEAPIQIVHISGF